MRLWIARQSPVSVREQLATQLLLAILGEDLPAGRRLPSTRELARRLGIHPNTVSAVYRDLTRRGWVEFRKGSGIYVRRDGARAVADAGLELEGLIASFFETIRAKGYPLAVVQVRLRHWLEMQPPDRFLVVEPDTELRRILAAEVEAATSMPVVAATPEECGDADRCAGAFALYLLNKEDQVRSVLPPAAPSLALHPRSALADLERNIPIRPEALVAVASGWPEFLRWARALLAAAGVDPDAVVLCDARQPGWRRRLAACTGVVTDTVTRRQIAPRHRVHVFQILSDASLAELRRLAASLASAADRL